MEGRQDLDLQNPERGLLGQAKQAVVQDLPGVSGCWVVINWFLSGRLAERKCELKLPVSPAPAAGPGPGSPASEVPAGAGHGPHPVLRQLLVELLGVHFLGRKTDGRPEGFAGALSSGPVEGSVAPAFTTRSSGVVAT